MAPLRQRLQRSTSDAALLDDLLQRLRERLLVGDAARIRGYSGRGSLHSWLGSAALRLRTDMQRQDAAAPRPLRDEGRALAALIGDPDPEMALLKKHDRAAFDQALQEALQGLPAAQRTLLCLRFVDGLNLDQIGVALGMHRSKAYRQVLAALETARRTLHRGLRQRLRLSATEFESLARLLRSQIEINLVAALQASRSTAKKS